LDVNLPSFCSVLGVQKDLNENSTGWGIVMNVLLPQSYHGYCPVAMGTSYVARQYVTVGQYDVLVAPELLGMWKVRPTA
jgi:hypothetical protein